MSTSSSNSPPTKKTKAVSPEDARSMKGSVGLCTLPWKELKRSPGSIEIIDPNEDVREALKAIGQDDPGVLLDWNLDRIAAAAEWANANQPVLPVWFPGNAYPITAEQLQMGIANALATAGGGQQLGRSLLAPNTDHQSNCIFVRGSYFMLADPFLAAICATADRHPIARLYLLGDGRRPMNGMHHPLPDLPAGYGVELFD